MNPVKSEKVSLTGNNQVSQTDSLQGHHETQVAEGRKADLHKHIAGCTKNPGHKQFIPVKKFKLKDLPDGYQDHDLYDLIKSIADLTVRVDVELTSPERPEFYTGTNDPFPFYDMKNKTTSRFGTGEIEVMRFTDGRGVNAVGIGYDDATGEKFVSSFGESTRTCPCTKCQHSDKPNNVWWQIFVTTATHVVYDDIETKHTKCIILYDEQNSTKLYLEEVSINYVNIDKDRCNLKRATCDSLGDIMYKMQVHLVELWWNVLKKYWNKPNEKFTFIVSHPHGCSKQISIGQLKDNYIVSEYNAIIDNTQLTYTTATCQGSSGARVHCLSSANGHWHRGVLDSGFNYSSVGFSRKLCELPENKQDAGV